MMKLMSSARKIKQFGYAGGCLGFVALIIIVALLLAANPSDQPIVTPSPSNTFKPIAVEQVSTVSHGGNIDIVARLRNVNVRAGVADYPVTFIVDTPQGQEMTRRQETTYILPGSLQYAVALNIPITSSQFVVRLEVPSEPTWQELPEGIRSPEFGSFLRGPTETRTVGVATIEQQKGIAANEGSYDLQRVEVVALAVDSQKNVVGIGKTFLGELKVGERREFTVQWPAPAAATADVITSLSANVFQEENVIRIIGDPNTLR